MKTLVLLLSLTLFVATSALAINPGVDVMGMYWDIDAEVACVNTSGAPTNMYVILTNPSMVEIAGFEFGYTIEAAAQPYILSAVVNGDGPVDMFPSFQDFMVGLATPTTMVPGANLLVTLQVMNAAAADLTFYLHACSIPSAGPQEPVILHTDDSLQAVAMNTEFPFPSAYMGADYENCGTIAAEDSTWDSVKSLYR